MTYSVKYRRKGSFFWRTLKNVTSDFLLPGSVVFDSKGREVPTSFMPVRGIYLEDKSYIELPLFDYEFKYSRGRYDCIKENEQKKIGKKEVYE